MDASALESLISSLESRSDSLDSWLTLWIIFIVVGLVIEVFVVVKDHFHKPTSPGVSHSIGKLVWALTGPVLITVGVAGELLIHVKSGRVHTDLRDANRKVFALLNVEAGNARKDAGGANERAGLALERASKAESNLAGANERAANALKTAEGFRLDIARAEERSANAQLDLAKFKAPRQLAPDQRQRIIEKVKPFAGQQFTFAVSPGAEALEFIKIVDEMLGSAGWVWQKSEGPILMVSKWGITIVDGILVQVAPSREPDLRKAILTLASALMAEGIEARAERLPALEKSPSTIHIVIGTKP